MLHNINSVIITEDQSLYLLDMIDQTKKNPSDYTANEFALLQTALDVGAQASKEIERLQRERKHIDDNWTILVNDLIKEQDRVTKLEANLSTAIDIMSDSQLDEYAQREV